MSDDFNVRLAGCLSADETRSGEAIAARLGCSRTAVWKHVESLRHLGVGVEAVAGLGYRLSEPLELLDGKAIERAMAPAMRRKLSTLRVHPSLDSTNAEVRRAPGRSQHGRAVLAERQTQGRGRRGRDWVSPFARNIYLSLGWQFDAAIGELACLPLVVALAAAEALRRAGLSGVAIKWPNDLLLDGRKLGGCLVEVQGDAGGPCRTVMGVGINVNMPPSTVEARDIDQPWTDVASQVPGVSRNRLAALLLVSLLESLEEFGASGFEPFHGRWQALDSLAGREILLIRGAGQVRGTAQGLGRAGGLLVRTEGGVREYHAGEVSTRAAEVEGAE